MPATGSTFTDWQQLEQDSLLFVDDDFGWSEPPQRRRRRITEEPVRARRAALLDYEPEERAIELEPRYERGAASLEQRENWDHPTEEHNHFDEMMAQWNAAYGDGARRIETSSSSGAFDLADPGVTPPPGPGRRTVVITGQGDARYMPAPRRNRGSGLRFHERSGFSPDRAGLWAVLLGVALVIGCVVH